MKVAQQEIKATVTVNTSDLGNKKKDDEVDRDAPSRKKGKCSPACSSSISWFVRQEASLAFLYFFCYFSTPKCILIGAFR